MRERVRRRLPRRPALGVDLGAVFDLVGGMLRWIGLAFLAPALVAAFAGEDLHADEAAAHHRAGSAAPPPSSALAGGPQCTARAS